MFTIRAYENVLDIINITDRREPDRIGEVRDIDQFSPGIIYAPKITYKLPEEIFSFLIIIEVLLYL